MCIEHLPLVIWGSLKRAAGNQQKVTKVAKARPSRRRGTGQHTSNTNGNDLESGDGGGHATACFESGVGGAAVGGFGVRGFARGILGLSGFKPVRITLLGQVDESGVRRASWLASMRRLGRAAR